MLKRAIAALVLITFIAVSLKPVSAQEFNISKLPVPGTMVNLSPAYVPVLIKGLKVHPENPLLFDFILDTGKSGLKVSSPEFKAESQKLIKYFLASLTIKEDDLWVNLSPYEKNRMIPDQLGQTELGRDMLAQDYILKQLTASLIYPEKQLGKEFWNRIYTKAQQMFGTSEIPVNTFNKVWIVADKAKILERNNVGYVVGAHLKVMLEEDYLALEKHSVIARSASQRSPQGDEAISKRTTNDTHVIASKIIRQIILPQLEGEVNQGQNFAPLRQMFYSMILASWYKLALKDAFLNQIYSNKGKIGGVLSDDPAVKEKIYQQYLKAYKKGVFNYIKEESVIARNPQGDEAISTIPRKYFSGGEVFRVLPKIINRTQTATPQEIADMKDGDMAMETVVAKNADAAMRVNRIKLEGQIQKMYGRGYSDPSVILKLAGPIRNNIQPLYDDLRAAVSPQILDMPTTIDRLHWTIVSTMKGIPQQDRDSFGLPKLKEGVGYIQKFTEEVKKSMLDIPSFRGKIKGNLFLTDNGVIIWVIDNNSKFAGWMQNQARTAFGHEYDRPGIVHMTLGRIKLADMSDAQIKRIERRINSILRRYTGANGLFAPEGELDVKTVSVGQYDRTYWHSVYEQEVNLSNAAMLTGERILAIKDSVSKKQEVLFVEDDPFLMQRARRYFERLPNLIIHFASSLDEAREIVKDHGEKLGLVITDNKYPEKKGSREYKEDAGLTLSKEIFQLYPDLLAILSSSILVNETLPAKTYFVDKGDLLKVMKSIFDSAMATDRAPGGIDLNAKNMGLDVAKDGKGIEMKFDPAMITEFQRGDFSGIVPVIIRITPITSALPILGLETSPVVNFHT